MLFCAHLSIRWAFDATGILTEGKETSSLSSFHRSNENRKFPYWIAYWIWFLSINRTVYKYSKQVEEPNNKSLCTYLIVVFKHWKCFNSQTGKILVSIISSLAKVVPWKRGERSKSTPSTTDSDFSIGPSETHPGKWCVTTKTTRALRSNLILNQRVSKIYIVSYTLLSLTKGFTFGIPNFCIWHKTCFGRSIQWNEYSRTFLLSDSRTTHLYRRLAVFASWYFWIILRCHSNLFIVEMQSYIDLQ
jgi:hypothetical protein